MTGEQLKAAANLQVFGVAAVSAEWKNVQNAYTPADSPVEINVEVSLLRRLRGAVNTGKGIDTDESGKVSGADARAKDFDAARVRREVGGDRGDRSPLPRRERCDALAPRSSPASRGTRSCGGRSATKSCSSTSTSPTCPTR